MYLQRAPPPECQPTCSNPMRECPSIAPRPGCVCPEGTVIDESQNRCVPLSNCSKPFIKSVDQIPVIADKFSIHMTIGRTIASFF